MLKDLQLTCSKVPVIYWDNQSALHIAAHPVFFMNVPSIWRLIINSERKLQTNILKLLPISSKDKIANFFTKTLLPQPFNNLLSKLGMIDIYHPPTYGGILHNEHIDTNS